MKTYTMKVKGTTSVLSPVDNKKTLYIDRTEFYNWFWTTTEHEIWGETVADELFSYGKVTFTDEILLNTFLEDEESIPVYMIINPEDIDDLSEIEDGELFLNTEKYNYKFKEVE